MDTFIVDQPKVSVIENDDDLFAGIGSFFYGGHDCSGILVRCRITGRVVREVQNKQFLVAFCQQRALHCFDIKRAVLESVEQFKLCADCFFEHERVIVPIKIRDDYLVVCAGEKFRSDAQAVGQRIGDDRI